MQAEVSFRETAAQRLQETEARLQHVLEAHPLPLLRELSRPRPMYAPYHALPELRQRMASIAALHGEDTLQLVLGSLLALQIRDFGVSALPFKVTEEVVQLYVQSFHRILNVPINEWHLDDPFLKDLALAGGHLFPAGERVVEPFSALQRSVIWAAGPRQALRFLNAWRRAGGNKPLFRLHVHLSERASLSADTWRQTCIRVLQMLRLNPGVKGVVGGSWFYDPDVVTVSPHLHFVHDMLRGSGVYWFRLRSEGDDSGALVTSRTRQRAFLEGSYTPQVYILFWPRDSALEWLKRQEDVV